VRIKLPLAFALVAFVIFLRPAPASADLTICNHTKADLKVAVAADWYDRYFHDFHYDNDVDRAVWGWDTVEKGGCKDVIPYNIYDLGVYIYAYAPSDTSIKWDGKTYKRCLDMKHNFSYGNSLAKHEEILLSCGGTYVNCANIPYGPQNDAKDQARPPCTSGTEHGVIDIDTNGDGNWIETLTPTS